MLAELGLFFLITAGVLAAAFSIGAGLEHCLARASRKMRFSSLRNEDAIAAMWITCSLLMGSFLCLALSFVQSDFSLLLVYRHSHSSLPLLYRISASWGQHEGSMLLFTLLLSMVGALLGLSFRDGAKKAALLPLGGLLAITGSLCFYIFFTSNPFARMFPVADNGEGFNPLLQDVLLASHPPVLYSGYVCFGVVYVLCIAMLAQASSAQAYLLRARAYAAAGWVLTTLGIGLGSFWAFYELGWGGFWAWDPVENISLLPWLMALALLHLGKGVPGPNKRMALTLAGILSFSFVLLGFLLVRSGVLSSVHSFSVAAGRGLFLGVLFALVTLAGVSVWVLHFRRQLAFLPDRLAGGKELGISLHVVLAFFATFCIALATFYPLLVPDVFIGAPFFNQIMAVTILPVFVLLPVIPLLALRKGGMQRWWRLVPVGLSALLACAIAWRWGWRGFGLMGLCALSLWIIGGALNEAVLAWKGRKLGKVAAMAAPLGHMGFGILLLGVCGSGLGQRETLRLIAPQEHILLGDYRLQWVDSGRLRVANYIDDWAVFELRHGTDLKKTIRASVRYYPVSEQTSVQVGLAFTGVDTLYVALGERRKEGLVVRVTIFPLLWLIYAGAALMATGGLFALSGLLRLKNRKNKLLLTVLFFALGLGTEQTGAQPEALEPALQQEHVWELEEKDQQRVIALSKRIRCPSCEGQSVYGSNAPAAQSIRNHIIENVIEEKSDAQIKKSLLDAYGAGIAMQPRLRPRAYGFWIALVAAAVWGIVWCWRLFR